MEEEFVPYELTIRLGQLGFKPNNSFGSWAKVVSDDGIKYMIGADRYDRLIAPLWQQAFDWFRIEKGYDLYIKPMSFVGFTQYYNIEIHHPKFVWDEPPKVKGVTYEEARLACLEKLIELITE